MCRRHNGCVRPRNEGCGTAIGAIAAIVLLILAVKSCG